MDLVTVKVILLTAAAAGSGQELKLDKVASSQQIAEIVSNAETPADGQQRLANYLSPLESGVMDIPVEIQGAQYVVRFDPAIATVSLPAGEAAIIRYEAVSEVGGVTFSIDDGVMQKASFPANGLAAVQAYQGMIGIGEPVTNGVAFSFSGAGDTTTVFNSTFVMSVEQGGTHTVLAVDPPALCEPE